MHQHKILIDLSSGLTFLTNGLYKIISGFGQNFECVHIRLDRLDGPHISVKAGTLIHVPPIKTMTTKGLKAGSPRDTVYRSNANLYQSITVVNGLLQ